MRDVMASFYGPNTGTGSLLSVEELDEARLDAKRTAEPPASSASAPANETADREPRSLWSRLAARWKTARQDKSQPPLTAAPTGRTQAPRDTPSRDHEGLNQVDADRQPAPAPRQQALWQPLIDPAAVFGEVWRSKRLIIGCAILGAVLGVAVAISTPRTYYAATDMLIDPRDWAVLDRDQSRGSLQADAALALIENQIRVMTSRPVLEETVQRLNLVEDTEFNGRGSAGLSPRALLGALRQLISSSDSGSSGDSREAIAVGNLGRALFVGRGGRTFVVSVGATTTDADKSALIANTLRDVYLDVSARLQAGSSGRAADELNARLDELRLGVEQAERAVETFKAENEIIDAQGRLITDDEITRLNDQLSQARGRTVELRARAQSARDLDVQAVVNGSLPEQIASGSMTELRAQYTSLQLAADRLTVRLGPRHPELLAVEAQLRGADRQIRTELSRIVASLQIDLSRAQQQEQELSAELARLKVRQGDLGNELVTLRELEREASAQRTVYETVLLRARETGEQRQLNTANVSIIAEAVPPLLPSGVSRSLISAAGLVLGLLFGIGLAGARGAWFGTRNTAPRPQLEGAEERVAAERQYVAREEPDEDDDEPEPGPHRRRPVAPVHEIEPTRVGALFHPLAEDVGSERTHPDPYPVGSYHREQDVLRSNEGTLHGHHGHDDHMWDQPEAESLDDVREGLRECRAALEHLTRQRDGRSRYGT